MRYVQSHSSLRKVGRALNLVLTTLQRHGGVIWVCCGGELMVKSTNPQENRLPRSPVCRKVCFKGFL